MNSKNKNKKEYGFARSYVTQNSPFIENELKKMRTIKSIWKELMKRDELAIPYNTFLYHVCKIITKEKSINRHQQNTLEQVKNKHHATAKFSFEANANDEELI